MKAEVKELKNELRIYKAALTSGLLPEVAAPKPKVDAPRPSKFSGSRKAQDIDNFIWGLEHYFQVSGIEEDKTKVCTASNYLTDVALLWWRVRCDEGEDGTIPFKTWKDFHFAFKEYFYPKNAQEDARAKMRQLKHDGTILEYVRKFSELKLQLPGLSDAEGFFDFKNGLQKWARLELARRDVTDLAKALSVAASLVEFENQKSEPFKPKPKFKGNWGGDRDKFVKSGSGKPSISSGKPHREFICKPSDIPRWRWEENRQFTTRTAYSVLSADSVADRNAHWSNIWRLLVPQRIHIFIWLIFHGRLLTNEERARRHLVASDSRCANVFGGVRLHGVGLARYSGVAAAEFVAAHNCRLVTKRLHQLPWCCSEHGWMKVNCVGAVTSREGTVAIGEVMRDCSENWRFGFSRSIGRSSVLLAELWAILDSLRHAWEIGIRSIRLETDSMTATKVIYSRDSEIADNMLLHDIKKFLSRDWRVQIHYITRSGNIVVDKLAKMSRDKPIGETLFVRPPLENSGGDGPSVVGVASFLTIVFLSTSRLRFSDLRCHIPVMRTGTIKFKQSSPIKELSRRFLSGHWSH
ncbi:hypothetical protein GQ457_11G032710 [Hibiscus cannabinus]